MTYDWFRGVRRGVALLSLILSLGASAASAAAELNADPVIPGVSAVARPTIAPVTVHAPTVPPGVPVRPISGPIGTPVAPTTTASVGASSNPGASSVNTSWGEASWGSISPNSRAVASAGWRGPLDAQQNPTQGQVNTGLTKPLLDLLTNPTWRQNAVAVAVTLFRALFLWELAETAGVWLWRGRQQINIDSLLTNYIGKLIQAALMVLLIINGPNMLGLAVSYTQTMALQVVASSQGVGDPNTASAYDAIMSGPIDIGSVVAFGMKGGATMLTAKVNLPMDASGTACDPWNVVTNPVGPGGGALNCVTQGAVNNVEHALAEQVVGFVIALIAAVAIWCAFILIGWELFGLTVEAVFQQNIGAVFLGFLGYNRVARYGWNYYYYIINVCGRMFVIFTMVGIGEVFFQNALTAIQKGPVDPASMFLICAAAWLFFFMVRKINKWAATLLSGQSLADGMHDYARPAVEAAAIGAAAVALGAGAMAGGLGAMKGAMVKNGIQGGAGAAGGGGSIAGSPARPVRPKLPPAQDTINSSGGAVPPPKSLQMSAKALPRNAGGASSTSDGPIAMQPPLGLPSGRVEGTSSDGPAGRDSSGASNASGAAGSSGATGAEAKPSSATENHSSSGEGSAERDSSGAAAGHGGATSGGLDLEARGPADLQLEPPTTLTGAQAGSAESRGATGAPPIAAAFPLVGGTSLAGPGPARLHREDSDQRAARAAQSGGSTASTAGSKSPTTGTSAAGGAAVGGTAASRPATPRKVDDDFFKELDRIDPGADQRVAQTGAPAPASQGTSGGARAAGEGTEAPGKAGGGTPASPRADAAAGSGRTETARASAVDRAGTVYDGEVLGPETAGGEHWEPGDRPTFDSDDAPEFDAAAYAHEDGDHDHGGPTHAGGYERDGDRGGAGWEGAAAAGAGFAAGSSFAGRSGGPGNAPGPSRPGWSGGSGSGLGPQPSSSQGGGGYGGPRGYRRRASGSSGPRPTASGPVGYGVHTTAAMKAAQSAQSAQSIAASIAAQANAQEAARRRAALRTRIVGGIRNLMTTEVTQGHMHARVDFDHLR